MGQDRNPASGDPKIRRRARGAAVGEVGARPWGGGVGGGGSSGDFLPAPGSVSAFLFLLFLSPVRARVSRPPRLRPLGLGEDAATTHVALEVGPRTLQRLSGCPLVAPTPWGSPFPPTRDAPFCCFSPGSSPHPCVRFRLSLAPLHPCFVPSRPPPPTQRLCPSVRLSGSPLPPGAPGVRLWGLEHWCLPVWGAAPACLGHPQTTASTAGRP